MLKEESDYKTVKLQYQTFALEQVNAKIGKIRFNRNLLMGCGSLTLITSGFGLFHSPSLMTNVLLGTSCFIAGAATALTMRLEDLSNFKQDIQSDINQDSIDTIKMTK